MTLFSFGVSLSSTFCVGLLRMLRFPPTGRRRSSKSWETETPDCLQVWVWVIFKMPRCSPWERVTLLSTLGMLGYSPALLRALTRKKHSQKKKTKASWEEWVSEWTHTCLTSVSNVLTAFQIQNYKSNLCVSMYLPCWSVLEQSIRSTRLTAREEKQQQHPEICFPSQQEDKIWIFYYHAVIIYSIFI